MAGGREVYHSEGSTAPVEQEGRSAAVFNEIMLYLLENYRGSTMQHGTEREF